MWKLWQPGESVPGSLHFTVKAGRTEHRWPTKHSWVWVASKGRQDLLGGSLLGCAAWMALKHTRSKGSTLARSSLFLTPEQDLQLVRPQQVPREQVGSFCPHMATARDNTAYPTTGQG